MRDIEAKIAHFVETQFPLFMREEGELFVSFLTSYFEWLEETGNLNYKARKLLSYDDVDTTLDEYITKFKNVYLNGLPDNIISNKRMLIKHALELYRAKGTERGYDILLKSLYGRDSAIYYPAEDILKLSDGTWNRRQYLEVTGNGIDYSQYVGQRIEGIGSRAQATVERHYQQRIKRKIIEVLELTSINGIFDTGELIRIKGSTAAHNLPKIVGSLNDISIIDGGAEFSVGDILDVVSSKGSKGKAKVTKVGERFGLVNFTLDKVGTGYTIDTVPKVYSQIKLNLANVAGTFAPTQYLYQANSTSEVANGIIVSNTASQITLKQLSGGFTKGNTIYSAIKLQLGKQTGTGTFSIGEYVYQSNGTANIGIGKVASIITDAAYTTSIYVSHMGNNDFFTTSTVVGGSNTFLLVGNTSGAQGYVFDIQGGNSTGSATIANVVGGGTGATFSIGNIFRKEIIAINTDYIRDYIDTSLLVFNEGSPLSGNVTVTAASNTVTGNGTTFTTQYSNGRYIQVGTSTNKQIRQISSITNNTFLSVTSNFDVSNTDVQHFSEITDFGFPKIVDGGNLSTILADALTYQQLEVGSIQYINGINPGEGYSLDPFVEITQPIISQLNLIEPDGTQKGNNAVVFADAGSLTGIIQSVSVIDSGYGYDPSTEVTLSSANAQFSAIGFPQVRSQGKSQGEWTTTRGFLNSDKYIQDSYYYQEYSYEVKTQLDFNLYKDIVKKLLHPAGVALFGKFVLRTEILNSQSTYAASSITQE